VIVSGNLGSIHVAANQAPISEVLKALKANFDVTYQTRTNLDDTINGTFMGDLEGVLSGVLRGYNYVIRRNGAEVELFVTSKSANGPTPNPTAQWYTTIPSAK
jgi:hypothetical protein